MACDMFLAFGQATVQGRTLFGINHHAAGRGEAQLHFWNGRLHSPDETIRTERLALPQVRQTCAVLGVQLRGDWGLLQGCNDQQVAVGVASWRTRRPGTSTGLSGTELVRLTLERSHSARHAVDVLTELIARHGHGSDRPNAGSAILLADASEAYVLEATGSHWALLECQSARAVADIGLIRQDWLRLAPGLAELAIQQGWWSEDGAKLDFFGSLGLPDPGDAWALKRWGKATLALAQHSGTLDAAAMRSLLTEHFVAAACTHPAAPAGNRRQASLVACLDAAGPTVIWVEAGTAAAPLWFPLTLEGQIPDAWVSHPPASSPIAAANLTPAVAERLQNAFDQDAEEFVSEARSLKEVRESAALSRLAEAMMHRHIEQWSDACLRRRAPAPPRKRKIEEDELVPFAFG